MFYNLFKCSSLLVVAFAFAACEKDGDRCNCVDSSGETSVVSVDEQDCAELTSPMLTCYPED